MYKPDTLTWLSATIAEEVTDVEVPPVQVLASLVGEFKVTRLQVKGGKQVVAFDRMADPDLADWLDDEGASHISYSGVSQSGDPVTTIVKLDSQQKWVAGSAKAVVYLISLNEFCGGYLSYVMLGTKFARMLFVESANAVVVECTSEFKDAHQDDVSFRDFLNTRDGFLHLPWDLAEQNGSVATWNGWSATAPRHDPEPIGALKVLLELNTLSVDILTNHHNHTPPFGMLSPPPCDRLPALAAVVADIETHPIKPTMDLEAKRFAVEEGLKTKPTPAVRTPKRTLPNSHKPDDVDDDNDGKRNKPDSKKDKGPDHKRNPPQDQGGDPGPSTTPHRYGTRSQGRAAALELATPPPSWAADSPRPHSPVDRWRQQIGAFGGNHTIPATPPFTPESASKAVSEV